MLHPRLTRIRQRLDALREGRVLEPKVLERAFAFLAVSAELPPLSRLATLDKALDRVGVHSAQDAALLRSLGVQKGRAGALAHGLAAQAVEALEEFEECVRRAERVQLAGAPLPGALTRLEDGFPRLARVVKVADIFEAPARGFAGSFELLSGGTSRSHAGQPASAKVAVAELWAARAKANTQDVVQKRRDLDAAHELLLRAGSELDRDRVRQLRMEVSQARERVRAVPPVRDLRELVRQVKVSARREPAEAYRSLRGLYERAVEAGDGQLAEAAHAALRPLLPAPEALRTIIERDDEELRPWLARGPAVPTRPAEPAGADGVLAQLAFELDEERLATFELAAGCSGYFDVEDALSQDVVEEEPPARRPAPRRVPYPTQTMTFETTGSLHEVSNFVIQDPRTILYDLASSRLPVRAYLEDDAPQRPKRVRRSAVRVYVCDASGSMHGPRARFRDAILIAELNNLRLKAAKGQPFDPLYFSFFNDSPTELLRVDTGAEAARQIEKLFRHSPAEGQTRITLALRAAFDSIRAAQGKDPHLARATVVLVTDGEDRIDLEVLRQARAPVGAVDISLSFISLGEENPDLRSLVLDQRKKGGRAFYHHLSDREIGIARTEFDSRFRTLLPREVSATPDVLEQLMPHLEALERIAEGRGGSEPVATGASFDALFPEEPPEPSGAAPSREELARLADILDAIGEAASLAPADQRGSEAVNLLQHLLSVYGLTVPKYLGALGRSGSLLRDGLARVRLLCRPFG